MDLKLKELVQIAVSRSPTSSVIVFVWAKSESVNLAALLRGVACHSDMTPQQVNDVSKKLQDASTRIVVSMTILGVALNVPSISDMIHFGYPWDFLLYIQESSRAGRLCNEMAWSTILISLSAPRPRYPNPDPFGVQLMTRWIHQDVTCRHIELMTFNNGVAAQCAALDGGMTHFCNVRQALSTQRPLHEGLNQC
jgi:hypothetical protein